MAVVQWFPLAVLILMVMKITVLMHRIYKLCPCCYWFSLVCTLFAVRLPPAKCSWCWFECSKGNLVCVTEVVDRKLGLDLLRPSIQCFNVDLDFKLQDVDIHLNFEGTAVTEQIRSSVHRRSNYYLRFCWEFGKLLIHFFMQASLTMILTESRFSLP